MPPPYNPNPEGVATLRQLLFSDGLSFVQLNYKSEWQQSKSRIDALEASPELQTLVGIGVTLSR